MSEDLLKVIAVVSMLVDHTGYVLFPQNSYMTIIGRIAFPVYAFMIAEGFCHSRDVKRYALRLFAFALISEVPFDLAFYETFWSPDHQNVFWTLFLGLAALICIERITVEERWLRTTLQVICTLPFGAVAQLMHTDYRWLGVGLIAGFYILREMGTMRLLLIPLFLNSVFSGTLENYGALGMIPLYFYNGKRRYTGKGVRLAFYILYPVHLLVLWVIKTAAAGMQPGGMI